MVRVRGEPESLIGRQGGETNVLDWATHREVVEALPVARGDPEHVVNGIVEVAADAGQTNARLFSLEVQHLADETGLPEDIPVERGAIGNQAVPVVGDHGQAEGPIARDVLTPGNARSQRAD